MIKRLTNSFESCKFLINEEEMSRHVALAREFTFGGSKQRE